MLAEFMRIVLEIINCILTAGLAANPQLVRQRKISGCICQQTVVLPAVRPAVNHIRSQTELLGLKPKSRCHLCADLRAATPTGRVCALPAAAALCGPH